MARIEGVTKPGLLTRLIYWFARRRLGKVPAPLRIAAENGAILSATLGYEASLGRARRVPMRLKVLAELEAARLIGCPF